SRHDLPRTKRVVDGAALVPNNSIDRRIKRRAVRGKFIATDSERNPHLTNRPRGQVERCTQMRALHHQERPRGPDFMNKRAAADIEPETIVTEIECSELRS